MAHQPAEYFPVPRRYRPQQRYEMPAPEIPMRHARWFTTMLVGFAVLLLVGIILGFWRAAATPVDKTLEPSRVEAPAPRGVNTPP